MATSSGPDDAEGQREIERSLAQLHRDPAYADTFAMLAPHPPLPSHILLYVVTELEEARRRGDLKEKLGPSKLEWFKFRSRTPQRPSSPHLPHSCSDDGFTRVERTLALWLKARQREKINKRKAGHNGPPSSPSADYYSSDLVDDESTVSSADYYSSDLADDAPTDSLSANIK